MRLGGEQLANELYEVRSEQIRCPRSLGHALFGFHEVTSGVHPTPKVHELVAPGDIVVGLVSIGHQYRTLADSGEQLIGQLRAAPGV
ncbi:hypothetical protein JOE11_000514 [Robbsia andropogonis]